jgi:hypothetical protein
VQYLSSVQGITAPNFITLQRRGYRAQRSRTSRRRRTSAQPPRFLVPRRKAEVAARHWQRSYSDYDTQKCGIAGFDRDNIDDGSFGVHVRPHLPQCPAGLGTCGDAVPVIHLCVWLLQRDGVLFRVP